MQCFRLWLSYRHSTVDREEKRRVQQLHIVIDALIRGGLSNFAPSKMEMAMLHVATPSLNLNQVASYLPSFAQRQPDLRFAVVLENVHLGS